MNTFKWIIFIPATFVAPAIVFLIFYFLTWGFAGTVLWHIVSIPIFGLSGIVYVMAGTKIVPRHKKTGGNSLAILAFC